MSGATVARQCGDGSACRRKAFTRKCGLLAVALVVAIFLSYVNACKVSPLGQLTKIGEVYKGKINVAIDDCSYWTLSWATINNEDTCSSMDPGSVYLLFEFWRLDRPDSVRGGRFIDTVMMLVANGAQPDYQPLIRPRLVRYSELGENGTYLDAAAVDNGRNHQRLLAPLNATRSGDNPGWFVTIANLDANGAVVYALRVTCVAAAAGGSGGSGGGGGAAQVPVPVAPCRRPAPDVEECGGPTQGTCGDPPQGSLNNTLRPSLNRVCYCNGDWGDVDCSTFVPRLANGGVVSGVVLPPMQWAYWQVSLPAPPTSSTNREAPPTLLVEMNRGGGGFGSVDALYGTGSYGGGDPVLVVIPKLPTDVNQLPYVDDFPDWADAVSFKYYQNLHFVLLRDFNTTLPAAPPNGSNTGSKTYEYYIAVFNALGLARSTRFPGGLGPQIVDTNVTIRVRWRTASASPSPSSSSLSGGGGGALCPGDCYFRGSCSDPATTATTAMGSMGGSSSSSGLVAPGVIPPPSDFTCSCQPDFGGPLCEGTLRSLTASTAGDGGGGTLAPGQWAFFLLPIDPSRYNPATDDLNIAWTVRDAAPTSTAPPATYYNALFTANQMAFPRLPLDPANADSLQRGVLLSYTKLYEDGGSWKPMTFTAGRLKAGNTYVLGLYNSDYVRQATYTYSLNLAVPSSSRTWLHPYMSVVLGVTASIILCLLITLCRRLLMRYGWGPFRPRADDQMLGPDGTPVSRVQVAQMPPRPRGVPAHVIDAFHSYEYRATRAEKEQLAKSRPEAQPLQPQPPPPQQPLPPPPPGGGAVELTAGAAPTPAAAAMGNQLLAPAAAAAAAVTAVAPGGASGSAPIAAADDNDEPQCAVCLCEYEEGECITQLPCKHEFHGTCIRKWLQTHYTCPICRESLLPDQPADPAEPAAAAAAAGGGGGPPPPLAAYPPTPVPQGWQSAAAAGPAGPPPPPEALMGAGGGTGPLVPMGGASDAAAAAAPPPPLTATPSGRPGLFSRMMDSVRLGGGSASPRTSGGVSLQPVESFQPTQQLQPQQSHHWQSQQQQDQALQWRRSEPWTGGGGAAAGTSGTSLGAQPTLPEPVPAALVAASNGPMGRCAVAERANTGGAFVVAAPPPPGSPQLRTRGPTAMLDYSARQRSGGGGASSSGGGGATSPNRLAAGRQAATPMPLGAEGGGAADAADAAAASPPPSRPQPREAAALAAAMPPQWVDEQPSPPPLGQSQSYTISGGGGGSGTRERPLGGSLPVLGSQGSNSRLRG